MLYRCASRRDKTYYLAFSSSEMIASCGSVRHRSNSFLASSLQFVGFASCLVFFGGAIFFRSVVELVHGMAGTLRVWEEYNALLVDGECNYMKASL